MMDSTVQDLETLFGLSLDLLCVAGMDGYFRRVNPAFERVLGYSEEDIKAKPFVDFVHPDDREATQAEVEKLSRGITTLRFENRFRRNDGSYRWLAWTSVPNMEDGLLYAVARDITESKRSFDDLLTDLPGMVYRCRNDGDWTMEFVSEGCRELTGYARDDVIENKAISYASLVHPDDRQLVWDRVQAAIMHGQEFELEYRIQAGDGREKWVWERGRAIYTEDGTLKSLQGFIADITEQYKLRSEINQLQKMESLGQLTGGIAHDFNNLLTVVIGNLQLLRGQQEGEPEIAEPLNDALESAWRGAELSQRLLAFSRKQLLDPERVEVNGLVEGMEKLIRGTISSAIDVRFVLDRNVSAIVIDRGQLENAILNLAINARDSMPDGGVMTIETTCFTADAAYADSHPDVVTGEYIVIEVHDTGTGMSAAVRERVFEPFFTTKEAGKGTGLGLSMVYGLVKQSGGHVRVYSEPDHGTAVKLFIPVAENAPDALADGVPTVAEEPTGGTERVLVVEDDPAVKRTLIRMLEELGYRTIEAASGSEALTQLRAQSPAPDLLLTDLVMPGGMNGTELAEEARKMHPDLKVLLSSGFSAQHVGGSIQFPLLRKPYRKERLAQAIRQALSD